MFLNYSYSYISNVYILRVYKAQRLEIFISNGVLTFEAAKKFTSEVKILGALLKQALTGSACVTGGHPEG